jgi:hypothetical protein
MSPDFVAHAWLSMVVLGLCSLEASLNAALLLNA